MDERLESILKELGKNQSNKLETAGRSVQIFNGENPIVSIDEEKKYAEFSDKFIKSARRIKVLQPLVNYLEKNMYSTNLDLD